MSACMFIVMRAWGYAYSYACLGVHVRFVYSYACLYVYGYTCSYIYGYACLGVRLRLCLLPYALLAAGLLCRLDWGTLIAYLALMLGVGP